MRDQGAHVIVDDLTHQWAPFYEDGIVTAAVQEVVTGDVDQDGDVDLDPVVYITSAGNEGRRSYEATFNPDLSGSIPGADGIPHLFATGDNRQRITIPTDGSVSIVLQWTEPYSFPADFRFNIYLFNSQGQKINASITNLLHNPLRVLTFENLSINNQFDLVITYNGSVPPSQPVLLKYYEANFHAFTPELAAVFNEYHTNSSTIFGHANSEYAITVGAADYWNTPRFGEPVPIITDYSSAGGTPILFPEPEDGPREKPDIVGPTNVNTTFYNEASIGSYPEADPEPDGFPNFWGTSAAAPHIAGLVALMLQANPDLTPQEVKDALTSTAINMDDPFDPRPTEVFDYGTGYGFVHGLNALRKVMPPKVIDVIVSDVSPDAPPPGEQSDTVNAPDFHLNTVDGNGLQIATVPVGGADTVRVVFSEMVNNIDINSLTLVGVRTGMKPVPTGFQPPTQTNNFTATWNFTTAFTISDYYLLSLPDTITDEDDNALDGDWVNPGRLFENPAAPQEGFFDAQGDAVSKFPSGDGTPGGDFNFVLTFFQGDTDLNLVINNTDFIAVLNHFFGPGGWVEGDFNGNGTIDTDDLNFVLNQFFFQLEVLAWKGDYNQNGIVDPFDEQDWEDFLLTQDEDGDFDRNGVVDNDDLLLLQNQLDLYFDSIG